MYAEPPKEECAGGGGMMRRKNSKKKQTESSFPVRPDAALLKRIYDVGGYYFTLKTTPKKVSKYAHPRAYTATHINDVEEDTQKSQAHSRLFHYFLLSQLKWVWKGHQKQHMEGDMASGSVSLNI